MIITNVTKWNQVRMYGIWEQPGAVLQILIIFVEFLFVKLKYNNK